MMKAAYKYYQHTTSGKEASKISLGSFNSGNAPLVRVTAKPARKAKIEFTAEERALLKLINNGQVGSLIAHYAPVDHE